MSPNKSLGQHWLSDQATLAAIGDFAGISPDDTVLEIGPGPGSLTKVLSRRAKHIIAVEFDKALADELALAYVSHTRVNIIHADILSFDLSMLPKNYKVVANVPYYITSAIVRKLLESRNPPTSATLLVQKEVAERIAAPPGRMSLLSVSAQFYSDITLGPIVAAKLFTPPPKVDSQVVRLDYTGPKFQDVDPRHFFRIIKAGFGERRKKLRSSLAGGLQMSKNEADDLLAKAGVALDARAQELSVDQWHRLYRSIVTDT